MHSSKAIQDLVIRARSQTLAGDLDAAIETLRKTCSMQPDNASLHTQLARILSVMHRFTEADKELDEALRIDPHHVMASDLKLHVLEQLGRPEQVIDLSRRLLAEAPTRLKAAVAGALALPQIYSGTRDVGAWREHFSAGLNTLLQWPHAATAETLLDLQWPAFLLAYQGCNDRELQLAHSKMLRRLLARTGLTDIPDRAAPDRGRIRTTFVSSFFRDCTVGHYFGSWVTDLPRDRFEISLVFTGPRPDSLTQALAKSCESFHQVPDGAGRTRQLLLESAPDLIVYPEVGMGGDTYLLSRMRLAPVQVAAWGHPVTTGSEVIDAFISCADMEPPDADEHYSERLIRLPGLGTRYHAPEVPPGATRAQFSLPEQARIYLVPQSLHKVHPDNDRIYVDLLQRDPHACLVFIAPRALELVGLFQQRLQRTMDAADLPPRQQVKFLPFLPWPTFRQLMTVSDVMLDTLHWSGGQTSIDALAAGLPIVTTRGQFMRGRQSAAMLEAIGRTDWIADSPEALVELAIEVASSDLPRAEIKRCSIKLFDQAQPIEALSKALIDLVRSR